MDVSPHPLNEAFAEEPAKFYTARPLALDISDEQPSPFGDSMGFERVFLLALRMGDPRYFDEASETLGPLTLVKTNTTYTFEDVEVPDNGRGPILELSLPSFEKAVTLLIESGQEPVPEHIWRSLTLNLPAGWDGDDLTLDFFRRTITDQTGADRSALLDAEDNDLWRLDPIEAGVVSDVKFKASASGEAAAYGAAATLRWEKGYY